MLPVLVGCTKCGLLKTSTMAPLSCLKPFKTGASVAPRINFRTSHDHKAVGELATLPVPSTASSPPHPSCALPPQSLDHSYDAACLGRHSPHTPCRADMHISAEQLKGKGPQPAAPHHTLLSFLPGISEITLLIHSLLFIISFLSQGHTLHEDRDLALLHPQGPAWCQAQRTC
jgi:hypothetical protein